MATAPEEIVEHMLELQEESIESLLQKVAVQPIEPPRLDEHNPTVDELFDLTVPMTAVEKVVRKVNEHKLTLEQLLDPDFCDYSS